MTDEIKKAIETIRKSIDESGHGAKGNLGWKIQNQAQHANNTLYKLQGLLDEIERLEGETF